MKEEKIAKKLDKIESVLEKHTQELLEHDEELKYIREQMATKDDMEKLLVAQDEMLVILKRLDEERISTTERIKRIEKYMEQQNKKLKTHDSLLHKLKLKIT